MYRVWFTQMFEIADVLKAREVAANLIKSALGGVTEADVRIEYIDKNWHNDTPQ